MSAAPRKFGYTHHDTPETDLARDKLQRRKYAYFIARCLADWRKDDTLVISLHGDWGTGKSTLAKFISHALHRPRIVSASSDLLRHVARHPLRFLYALPQALVQYCCSPSLRATRHLIARLIKRSTPKGDIPSPSRRASVIDFNPWKWGDKSHQTLLEQIAHTLHRNHAAFPTYSRLFASFFSWGLYTNSLKSLGQTVHTLSASLKAFLTALTALGIIPAVTWLNSIFAEIPFHLYLNACATCLVAPFKESYSVWILLLVILSILSALVFAIYRLASSPSLPELSEKVTRRLKKLPHPIVIFIDDVDRLTKPEIHALIAFIKANLQFPKLAFVLLCQKEIVARALESIICEDGHKFLQKIVHIDLPIPAAPEAVLKEHLIDETKTILKRYSFPLNQERFDEIFHSYLSWYFTTLRDNKRFLSTFEFILPLHQKLGILEVDPIDLFAIETIRLFAPRVHAAIALSFFQKHGDRAYLLHLVQKKPHPFADDIKDICSNNHLSPEVAERLGDLLKALFPQATGRDPEAVWKSEYRICDPDAFTKYFQYTVNQSKASAWDLNNFLQLTNEPKPVDRLSQFLVEIDKTPRFASFIGLLASLRAPLPLSQLKPLILALFNTVENLKSSSDRSNGTYINLRFFISHQLNQSQDNLFAFLRSIYLDTQGLVLPASLISDKQDSTSPFPQLTSVEIEALRGIQINRICNNTTRILQLYCPDIGFILHRWKEWEEPLSSHNPNNSLSQPITVRTWIQATLDNPAHAYLILEALATKVTSDRNHYFELRCKNIEPLVCYDALLCAIGKFSSPLSAKQTELHNLLITAVKRKAAGQSYELIGPREEWET
jgi:hypothetical protein